MVHPPSLYDPFGPFAIVAAIGLTVVLVLLTAWRVGATVGPDSLIPDARPSLRNFVEVLFEGVCGLAEDVIGHDWKSYMPYIGSLGLFILIGNLLNLVPGLGAPTSFIETNLSWAILSVTTAEVATIRIHGFGGWLKHLAPGPWWLAPLILPIELFSHLVRYFSLTIRLTANMFADHTLLSMFIGGFGTLVAVLVPWIVLGLGLFVCFVQAFIFTFLTMLYIGMGVEESH